MVEVMSSGEEAATSTPVAGETSVAPSHPTHHELQRESQVKRFEAIGGLLQAVEDRLLRVPPEEVASWSTSETATTSQHIADHLRTKGWGSDSHLVEGSVTLLQGAITQEKAIQHLWEQDFGQEKAQQQAATWLEASFARTHPDAASLQIDEKVQEQLRVERVLGGIAISNIPTEIFAQIAVASMDHNGQKEEDRDKIVDALVNMPGVAITVPIKDFLPEDQVREDISDAYVVLVKEGPRDSMQAALRHEVHGEVIGALMERAQQEIPVLADYARRFGEQSEVRSPMAKAISDLAARTAEGDVDITVASLGISRAFAEEHPEKVAVLDRLVQTAREKVTSGSEEERTAFARMILGGMINSERLLEYVDPDNTTKPTDLGALFKETFSLTSVFPEGRFIYTQASLRVGEILESRTFFGTRYKVRQNIGSGGYGTTYRASVVGSSDEVLIKEAIFRYGHHALVNRLANYWEANYFFDEIIQHARTSQQLVEELHRQMGNALFDIFANHFNNMPKSGFTAMLDRDSHKHDKVVLTHKGIQDVDLINMLRVAVLELSEDQNFLNFKVLAEDIAVSIENEYTAEGLLRAGPGIPRIYETINHKDFSDFFAEGYQTRYLIEQFIQGHTVSELSSQVKSLDQVLSIILPALSTLRFAHDNGVVHRDVKPANMIQDAHGEVWLIDWGVAKGPMLRDYPEIGTPIYLPDLTESSFAADVHAIGVTFYLLSTGKFPYVNPEPPDKRSFEHLDAKSLRYELLQRNVPHAVAEVIIRAIQPDPVNRYINAGEMQEALLTALRSPAGYIEEAVKQGDAHTVNSYMTESRIRDHLRGGELPEQIMTALNYLAVCQFPDEWRGLIQQYHPSHLQVSKGFETIMSERPMVYGVRKFEWFHQWWYALENASQREGSAEEIQQLTVSYFDVLHGHMKRHPSDIRYLLDHLQAALEPTWSPQLDNAKGAQVATFLERLVSLPSTQLTPDEARKILDLWEQAFIQSHDRTHTIMANSTFDAYKSIARRFLSEVEMRESLQRIIMHAREDGVKHVFQFMLQQQSMRTS